eukprot:scaffold186783_cov35-Tisochrysis_lutea.AAC.2
MHMRKQRRDAPKARDPPEWSRVHLPQDVLDVLVRERLAGIDDSIDVLPRRGAQRGGGQHVEQVKNVGVTQHAQQPDLAEQPFAVRPVVEGVEDLLDSDAACVASRADRWLGRRAALSIRARCREPIVRGRDDSIGALADDRLEYVSGVYVKLHASQYKGLAVEVER